MDGTLVRVRGGYNPDVVYARAGVPIKIAFLREETAPCSEQVVFPAFGKTTTLQRGRMTVVDLPPSEPGTYEFTCAMKMLHGRLVVEGRDEQSRPDEDTRRVMTGCLGQVRARES